MVVIGLGESKMKMWKGYKIAYFKDRLKIGFPETKNGLLFYRRFLWSGIELPVLSGYICLYEKKLADMHHKGDQG